MNCMQRRAILGGTFNPPHLGHLAAAAVALDQAALHQVIWVPAGQPPHRTIERLTTLPHRLEMIRLAIAPYPAFSLSTVDCDRASPSYAVHTLLDLQRQYPASHWYWIIGLDAFQTLPRWYRRLELIPQCTWLVAPRPIHPIQSKPTQPGQLTHSQPGQLTHPQPGQLTHSGQADSLNLASRDLQNNPEGSNPTVVSTQAVVYPPVFENSSPVCCQQVVQQLASQQIEIQWQLLDMPPLNISSSLIRQQLGDRRSISISTLVPAAVDAYIRQHQLYEPVS